MFWNIFKLGSSKLGNRMNAGIIAANGLGNNIQDYIVKVATGNAVWNAATTTTPVDVLVIIELVSGGNKKDSNGFGACIRVLKALKASMNAVVALNANYNYDYAAPKLIGNKECVGVIYNTVKLTSVSNAAMRNTANNFLLPRTAFWARFTQVGTLPLRPMNIVGIHGPTSNPVSADYKDAVTFTNDLYSVAQLNQGAINPKEDTCIGGDYNCDPLNTYAKKVNSKSTKISAFADLTNLANYKITLPNGTLTSLRNSINGGIYLSQPYDNIVFQLPAQFPAPPVRRVDLVGNAPIFGTNPTAVFNAARAVSDHLPLTIAY
jgi:hypothetical protein